MFSIMEENGKPQHNLMQYMVDKEDDINSLPNLVAPGSTCIVVETSNVYILNNEKKWKKLGG